MSLIATGVPVTQGTWTPSIGGNTTYTTQTGVYTRIGRLVHFQCLLVINVIGTGSTSTISGLPFTSISAPAGSAVIGFWAGSATSYVTLTATVPANTTTIALWGAAAAAASVGAATFFANSSQIIVSGSYTV